MSERDEQADPDVQESVDAFRRAGVALSDGLRMLYERTRTWFERRHSVVRGVVAVSVWFGGNWAYNRIAPTIIGTLKTLFRRVSLGFTVTPVFRTLEDRPVLVSVPVLLVLLVTVVVQNRAQTRKLSR